MDQQPVTVLFVDDEPMILRSVERLMKRERFRTLYAGSAFEALQMLVDQEVDIVVSDYDMPAIDGLELFDLLRKERKDVVRIMMTGRLAMNAWESGVDNGSVQRLIEKPWRADHLVRVLDEAADAVHARRESNRGPDPSARGFRRQITLP